MATNAFVTNVSQNGSRHANGSGGSGILDAILDIYLYEEKRVMGKIREKRPNLKEVWVLVLFPN